jgi:hypothetical protein
MDCQRSLRIEVERDLLIEDINVWISRSGSRVLVAFISELTLFQSERKLNR